MPNWFHRKALFFQSNILNCTTLSISRKKSSFWSKTCYSKLVLIDFTKKNLNSRCFWPRCFNGHAVLTNAILTTCHFDHLLFCPQAVLTWWNFDPRSFGRRNFVWRYYFRPPQNIYTISFLDSHDYSYWKLNITNPLLPFKSYYIQQITLIM